MSRDWRPFPRAPRPRTATLGRTAGSRRVAGPEVEMTDRVHPADREEPPGGKDRHRPGCGSELRYCFEFDAAYCPVCDVWTESGCSEAVCGFCPPRPSLPSGAHQPTG